MGEIRARKVLPLREEVLRYLGHHGQEISPEMEAELLCCMEKVYEEAIPRSVCQRFSLCREQGSIVVKGTALVLTGEDIAHLLAGSEECFLLAVTLGSQVERLLGYTQRLSMTRALLMDCAATAMIEAVCDDLESRLRSQIEQEGLELTWRYSCGYGDLPLALQKDFLAALNAQRRIGLTCNEDFIMIPRKSVTAVMGVGEKGTGRQPVCSSCPYNESCNLRKAGKSCGR